MAEYNGLTTDDRREKILSMLAKQNGIENLAMLQALTEDKIDSYQAAYNDYVFQQVKAEAVEMKVKMDFAATNAKLKADYEAFMGKVDAELAAVEAPPAEEPVEP